VGAVIHRRDTMNEARFQKAIANARDQLIATAKRAPERSEAQNMAKRFRQHGDAYFRFITTPGIEPTNNLAEQAIRFVVIDRRITQGTRSPRGRKWSERIWTTIATCTQQGRSVFDFIQRAIYANFTSQTAPSLSKIAREGLLFQNALAPSSWTKPSVASYFTGRYSAIHGVDGKDDLLPKRLLKDAAKTGPAKGLTSGLDRMLPEYYELRGWDANGVPSDETKSRLSL